ncbi:MAG TPA: beta-ketoacyl-[acyl-carrier-protein] synthase family protein [Ktedonobacteraceae bacterium]|nr:beta-ketoacyl-[acyl-carrier-protein] synthase family protein [Ktedonobacteraceae bacterium]
MQRRVVITGLGVVAPNGIGKENFWKACISGRSGIRRVTRFDASPLSSQIAGEVPNFNPEALGLTKEEWTTQDRGTQFSIAAANLALQDAGLFNALSDEERDRSGVYMGTAIASMETGEKLWLLLTNQGTQSWEESGGIGIPASLRMTNAPASAVATHHQFHGPCTAIATGCSAGADAIGQAFWAVQEGRADRMLAGGADSAITYAVMDVFCVVGAMSKRNEEPQRASRPYDRDRDGFIMAEGAGILLLEEREVALARNAHIYAEVIVFNSNINAHHMTTLPTDGAPLQQLLKHTLREAGITPAQLDYINSHGSSTPPNEAAETAAYKGAFGEQAYHIPISSTKSMIGHSQGAASAIEAIATTLTIENQVIHPTVNQENPDPNCDLDYVPNIARPAVVNVALSHSSGFGGVNSALVLARPHWLDQQR